MNLGEARQIGRTQLALPVLGLGGSTLGGFGVPVTATEDETRAAYEAAWEVGFRYFDTAPRYGNGESRLGHALRGHPRNSFMLSTKVGITRDLPPAGTQLRVECNYGYDATLRSIDASLRRLRTDRLEIVFIHDIGPQTHGRAGWPTRFREAMDGAYPALKRLRSEGVVQAIGVGVNSCAVCVACLKAADFDVFMLAGRYTLLDQGAAAELLPLCRSRGASIVVAAPFNSGILATGARNGARYDERPAKPETFGKVSAIEAVCAEHAVSLGAAAVQFPLTHPVVAAVVPGPRNADQIREVAGWFAEPIPEALWRGFKHALVVRS